MNKNTISICIDGKITTHIPSENSNYATLCGLDGSDEHPTVNQKVVDKKGKINCVACFEIWKQCLSYSPADFSKEVNHD